MRLENGCGKQTWTRRRSADVTPSDRNPHDATSDVRPDVDGRCETAGKDGFNLLPAYELEAVLCRCDLASLANMAQVDRRSVVAVRNVFRYHWSETLKRRKLTEAFHANARDGIACAQRQGMTVDAARDDGNRLLTEALRCRLDRECYTALLPMVEQLDAPVFSLGKVVGRKYDVLAAAIYHRNVAAIRAIVADGRFLVSVDSEGWASRVFSAIRTGNVAVLKALMTSGKVDLNQDFRCRLPLRYEMTRRGKGLRMMHFMLSRPEIDVNADGVMAGMGHVDVEKFKLLQRHRYFDINKVSSGNSKSSPLSRSIEWALFSGDSALFDLVISDPRTDVMRCVRSIDGMDHRPIDILHSHRRSGGNPRRDLLRRYIAKRIESHPSFRKISRCSIS